MFKQVTLFLLACSLAGVAGCGGGSDKPAVVTEKAAVKKDPIELVIYNPFVLDWPEDVFIKTFGEPIMKKFPHITVKYIAGGQKGTSVAELLTAGQRIDILSASLGAAPANLLDNGLQFDITPLVKKFNYDLTKLEPTMVEAIKKFADGGMYGLPVFTPPSSIYYNKDIFDKFGVPYPKDGMTWDDLYEMSKKLTRTDGGVQYYGLATSYGHLATMNQFSLPLVDQNNQATYVANDRWKPWVDNLVRFYKLPGFAGLKTNQLSEPYERNRFFKDRNIAMFLALTALHNETEIGDLNWDLASFPVFKDMPGIGPQAYPTYFYVTSMAEKKDDAFEVIAYLTSEEFQTARAKEGKLLPVLNNKAILQMFGQDGSVYKGKNVKALQPAKYAPPGSVSRYNGTSSGELNVSLREVNSSDKDVNTALREATERANKKISEAEAARKK